MESVERYIKTTGFLTYHREQVVRPKSSKNNKLLKYLFELSCHYIVKKWLLKDHITIHWSFLNCLALKIYIPHMVYVLPHVKIFTIFLLYIFVIRVSNLTSNTRARFSFFSFSMFYFKKFSHHIKSIYSLVWFDLCIIRF